jgi:alcohol dehydrogenase
MGRAVLFHGPQSPLEIVSHPEPTLREGELLVNVLACTLCRSDLHSHAGRRPVETPTILGHEIVGTIAAFGPNALRTDMSGQTAEVGDRVTWSIVIGCGDCVFCRLDLPQKCERLFKYGHEAIAQDRFVGGGLADRVVLLPRTSWLKLPAQISNEVAALANCAAATAAALLRSAGGVANQNVLIIGAGVLGSIACAMASAAGARRILAVDSNPGMRERAPRFGATQALDPMTEDLLSKVRNGTDVVGADVVFELAGSGASVEHSLRLVRTGGTVVLAGTVSPGNAIAIEPEGLVRRMITVRGVHNYHPQDLVAATEFLAGAGRAFPLEQLIHASYPLDRAAEAFSEAHLIPGARVVVTP